MTVLAVLSAGCSGDPESTRVETTTTSTPGRPTSGAAGDCPMRMPDELVPEIEAVVRFDVDRICPGYLRVAPGTTIRILNESDKAVDFSVEFGEASPGRPVFDESIPAGSEATVTVDDPGFYRYRTDLIPSFVGTFDVPSG